MKKQNYKEKLKIHNQIRDCRPGFFRTKQQYQSWSKRNRLRILKERGNKCEHCGSKDKLQIHHVNYTYHIADLLILCTKCHSKEHDY